MLRLFVFLLVPLLANAAATGGTEEPCAVIRTRIGVVPLADPDLLRTLAARKDCAFSAAEVYRAAHGDKPPAPDRHDRRRYPDKEEDD